MILISTMVWLLAAIILKPKWKRWICCSVVMIQSLLLIFGYIHGNRNLFINYRPLINGILHTPIESGNKEGLLVFYKFDCKDCHVIFPETQAAFDAANASFINMGSKQGKELALQYNVSKVPTALCTCTGKSWFLVQETEKGIGVNREAMQEAIISCKACTEGS